MGNILENVMGKWETIQKHRPTLQKTLSILVTQNSCGQCRPSIRSSEFLQEQSCACQRWLRTATEK